MLWIKKNIEQKPKNLKKVIIFSLLALFLVAFIFFPDVAFADSANWLLENDLYAREVSQIIGIISHIVYVFIWPCLAIAGTALDNSLIYGSFLHLDAALWNIWNIMKNFANFTLWFIFVFTIVKNLFAWSFGSSSSDPMKAAKDTIVRTLIAWVLVQMSRFLVAALIDLSTILIYAVWWIPLSMLWSYGNSADNKVLEMPIMKLNTEFDKNDVSYYYSYSWYNFSTCYLANKGWDVKDNVILEQLTWNEYIAWRRSLYVSEGVTFETWYCVLNWYLYKYEENPWFFCDLPWWTPGSSWCYEYTWFESLSTANASYLHQLKLYLEKLGTWAVDARNSCYLISAYNREYDTWSSSCTPICSGYWEVPYTWDILWSWFKLKDLMENSKWRVWPFVTMYSSILNYQDLVIDPGNYSVMWNLFGLLINTFFALVLFIPMAILMVLLIIRIGYLWVVVAISPILVLLEFGLDKSVKDKFQSLYKKFSVTKIIERIFSPVIVVFTVSLCIVFLSTIYKSKPNYDNEAVTLSAFWIEKVEPESTSWDSGDWGSGTGCFASWHKNVSEETYSILGLVTVKMKAQNYNHWKSMFAWVLVELLATGMVRFFMKFAISAMWEPWKKLMESAEEFVKSVPIIPLPGGKWSVGIKALEQVWPAAIMDRYSRNIESESNRALEAALPWAFPWWGGRSGSWQSSSSSVSSEAIGKVVTEINAAWWAWKVKYDNLSQESKTTLTAMYWGNAATNIANFMNYYDSKQNGNKYTAIIAAGDNLSTPSSTEKTNIDALNFKHDILSQAILSDPSWIGWANSMKWKFVELNDWVYIVDDDGWLVLRTMNEYEVKHFKKSISSITSTDYQWYSKSDQDLLAQYIRELEEEIDELDNLNTKAGAWSLQWDEAKKQQSLQKATLPSKSDLQNYQIYGIIK